MKNKTSLNNDGTMIMQGFTRAFFMWVLKTHDEDFIYHAFVDLMEEYKLAAVPERLFFVMLGMGMEEELVDEGDVEHLRNALLKNDVPLYQWSVPHLDAINRKNR
jgi:hypothetical protein